MHLNDRIPTSSAASLLALVSLRHEKQDITIHCVCMFYFTIITWCFYAGQEGWKPGLPHPSCCLQEPQTPKAEAGGMLQVHPDHVALLWRSQLLEWLFYAYTSSYDWLAPAALLNRRGRRWQLPLLTPSQESRDECLLPGKQWYFVPCSCWSQVLLNPGGKPPTCVTWQHLYTPGQIRSNQWTCDKVHSGSLQWGNMASQTSWGQV